MSTEIKKAENNNEQLHSKLVRHSIKRLAS